MHNTGEISGMLPLFFAEIKRDARSFGALPITALTAGKMEIPGVAPDVATSLHDEWVAMNQEIVSRSTRGRWLLAERSTHYIQKDQPELVVQAVRDMLDSVRVSSGRVPASTAGTTGGRADVQPSGAAAGVVSRSP